MNFIKKHPKAVIILIILFFLAVCIIKYLFNWYSEKGYVLSESPDRQYSVRMLEFPIWGIISDEGLIRVYDNSTGKKISENYYDEFLLSDIKWYRHQVRIRGQRADLFLNIHLKTPVKCVKSLEEKINDSTVIYNGKEYLEEDKYPRTIHNLPIFEHKPGDNYIYTHGAWYVYRKGEPKPFSKDND